MSLHLLPPSEVRSLLRGDRELAFIDLREAGPHGRSKPLFAVNIPLGRLEERIAALVPRRDTPVVLFDAGQGFSARGAARLAALGYTDVSAVSGGLVEWRLAGGELFRDTSVPSKAFGEVVEHEAGTPEIDAGELKRRIDRGDDLVVIDDRPYSEYRQVTVPGSINIPGAELVLRAQELLRTPDTQLVVHCAGRTRSLIGTQALINAGIFNNVVGLRHGNIGWHLAGYPLEYGADRRGGAQLDPGRHARAREAARALAERTGVRFIDEAELAAWEGDATRSLFKFDVRSPEEFAGKQAPGFAHAAGGQLIQATDEYIGVLRARVVLADTDGVRAAVTASWLRQFGFPDVAVLASGLESRLQAASQPASPSAFRPFPAPAVPSIDVASLAALLGKPSAGSVTPPATAADITADVLVLDLRLSTEFAAAHIPGSWQAARARLAEALPALPLARRIVLVSADGYLAAFAQAELQALTPARVEILAGGFTAWKSAGLPTAEGSLRLAHPADDVYLRPLQLDSDAGKAHYIAWELGLPGQIERDGTAQFTVHRPEVAAAR